MKTLLILILLITVNVEAKMKTIAVIDSGFGANELSLHSKHLCQEGHKDFTRDQEYLGDMPGIDDPIPYDHIGHGTNIAGIIEKYAVKTGKQFCLVIIKIYGKDADISVSTLSIRYAKFIGADYINYSGGGNNRYSAEVEAVTDYIDHGGIFVAAAGNENSDLEKQPYYPAMNDRRVIVVGNLTREFTRSEKSNYGKAVDRWEYGEKIEAYGLVMTGTSQATAVATGKLLGETKNSNDKRKKRLAIRK